MPRKKKNSKVTKYNLNKLLDINSTDLIENLLEDLLADLFNEDNEDLEMSSFLELDLLDYLSLLLQDDLISAKLLKKQRRSKEYYVKGKDLIELIRKYQESLKNDPEGKGYISELLGSMILKICTRFSLHPKFYGYTYRDLMVADAVTRCISKSIARIDLSLPNCNPFSYFTQTALNCFRGRINALKKFMNTKQRYRLTFYNLYENLLGIQHTKDNDED